MHVMARRGVAIGVWGALLFCAALALRGGASTGQEKEKAASARKTAGKANAADTYRFNTLGVAHMNQQRPADAQKYFEQALGADPKFTVARLNLGVALLGQQKLDAARAALTAATEQLPNDPYAWYNLGLAYKDTGEAEKGIAAFRRVTAIKPNEADAYYFVGYLNTQIQKYDEAIAAFQKGLTLNPVHASAEFGLARALQRKGDSAAARERLARFQKITTEHLGTPFGAGYGDQGRYSLAELPKSTITAAPAPIKVNFTPQPLADAATKLPAATGACFFDFDNDGKPDLFLVSATNDGGAHLLRNLGDGKFADVTQQTGIHLTGAGQGCVAGDYDNDGHTDLAVCLADGVHLLHNKDGKFDDVTETVGIRR